MMGGLGMATELRRLGRNIEIASKSAYRNIEDFAKEINLSTKDMYRLFEGRLLLAPSMFMKIAEVLKKPLNELLDTSGEFAIVECMGSFKDKNNEDKVLDIIDNYIDLIEAIS